jgi:hypothetical protein
MMKFANVAVIIAALVAAPAALAQTDNPLAELGYRADDVSNVPDDAFTFSTSRGLQKRMEFVFAPMRSVIAVFRVGAPRPAGIAAIKVDWSLDCTTGETRITSYAAYSDTGQQVGNTASGPPPELASLVTNEAELGYWKKTCNRSEFTYPAPLPALPRKPLSGNAPLSESFMEVAGALEHARLRESVIAEAKALPARGRFSVASMPNRTMLVELDRMQKVGDRTRITWIETNRMDTRNYRRVSRLVDCVRKTQSDEFSARFASGKLVELRGPGPEWPTKEMDELCQIDPAMDAPVITLAEALDDASR